MCKSRKQFLAKLYEEYLQFKHSMLNKSKKDIYEESYKIEVFTNLYEILIEKQDRLSDAMIENLLRSTGLLEFLYQHWLKKEDGFYDELVQYVDEELKTSDNFN